VLGLFSFLSVQDTGGGYSTRAWTLREGDFWDAWTGFTATSLPVRISTTQMPYISFIRCAFIILILTSRSSINFSVKMFKLVCKAFATILSPVFTCCALVIAQRWQRCPLLRATSTYQLQQAFGRARSAKWGFDDYQNACVPCFGSVPER
jgi:hypothetical protein